MPYYALRHCFTLTLLLFTTYCLRHHYADAVTPDSCYAHTYATPQAAIDAAVISACFADADYAMATYITGDFRLMLPFRCHTLR